MGKENPMAEYEEIVKELEEMNEKPQKIYIGHNYIWHTSPYGDSNFEYLPAESLKELRGDYKQLLKTFGHCHINNGEDDACEQCGLDLRNEIHFRSKELINE